MTRDEIERNLRALGGKLAERGVHGEIMVAGGAAMMLTLANRDVTQDVDAFIGGEAAAVREAALEVAREHGLPASWLNDAVKGFFYAGTPPHGLWAVYGHLTVYVVDPRYLFAMKAAAARHRDIDDMVALVRHLGLRRSFDRRPFRAGLGSARCVGRRSARGVRGPDERAPHGSGGVAAIGGLRQPSPASSTEVFP